MSPSNVTIMLCFIIWKPALEYMSHLTYGLTSCTTPKHIINTCKDRIRRYDRESSQT